jgi:hypothetical protein
MPASGLDPRRGGHYIHHHERGNIAASGGCKKAVCPGFEDRIWHGNLLSARRYARYGMGATPRSRRNI